MKQLHHIPTSHQIGFSTSTQHKPNMASNCCGVATCRFRVTTPFNVWSNDAFLSSLPQKLWPFSHFSPLRGLDPTILIFFPNVKFRHCACKKVQQAKFLLFFHLCGVQGSISMKLQWQQKKFLLPLWRFRFYRCEGSLPTFFFSLPWNSKFCRCKGSTATTFFFLSPMCSFDISFFHLCGEK